MFIVTSDLIRNAPYTEGAREFFRDTKHVWTETQSQVFKLEVKQAYKESDGRDSQAMWEQCRYDETKAMILQEHGEMLGAWTIEEPAQVMEMLKLAMAIKAQSLALDLFVAGF